MADRSGLYGEKRRDAVVGTVVYGAYFLRTLPTRVYNAFAGIVDGDNTSREQLQTKEQIIEGVRQSRIDRTLRSRLPDVTFGI